MGKMMIMPANACGWFWHCLARETGCIGNLFSPNNQRGPWPWMPYSLDNGVFSLWSPETNQFDEKRWLESGVHAWRRLIFWASATSQKPLWGIVPDRPGDWDETRRKWEKYTVDLTCLSIPLAVAVQDGATPESVRDLDPQPQLVCVGGSTHWKWLTAQMWAQNFPRVHLLRCNSPERLYWLEEWGFESTDGTGWNRGDRTQTEGVERFCRRNPEPITTPIYSFVSRAEPKQQMTFA